jgi:endonuclease/exonuclease/phosphatase family metal-dependent hydrolase
VEKNRRHKKVKTKTLDLLIKIVFFIVIFTGGYTVYDTYYEADTVKIANWNLQIFGQSKASNINLMQTYISIIEKYDIVFVQEIRDKSETAFSQLCLMLQNYSCVTSSRAGRTNNKEQYGVIYKNEIGIISFEDFNPDKKDRWERPPIKIKFNISNYELIVYNIHTKPEDVKRELNYLENVVSNSGNVLILGDLNADCSYYNNEKQIEFNSWNWEIKDYEDTTVGNSNCAYDRIILNNDAKQEYKSDGIYKKQITNDVSDHYLVWVELKII